MYNFPALRKFERAPSEDAYGFLAVVTREDKRIIALSCSNPLERDQDVLSVVIFFRKLYRFCFFNLAFFLRENVGSSPYTLHIDRTVYFLPYRKFAENDTCNALLNAVFVRFVVVQYRKNKPFSAEIK